MFRVTSLTSLDDRQLNRWIKRLALLLVAGTILFTAFYFLDRWRAPAPAIVDQRVAALEQAVRDDPEDIASRGSLADIYVEKGRFEEAVAQYDAILETGEAEELAKFGRAAAYMGLGELDKAAADYEAVVDIAKGGEMANVDPMLEAAYYGLGSIAMQQARPADAVTLLQKALSIDRSDADALYLLGTAFVATGDTDKAESVLRSAVAFVPIGWSEPYAALAEAFTKAGKTSLAEWAGAMGDMVAGNVDAAESRLEAILDTDAGVDAAIGLGLIAETRGDSAAAAGWYQRALAESPDNSAARLGMGRVSPGVSSAPLPPLPTPGTPAGGNE